MPTWSHPTRCLGSIYVGGLIFAAGFAIGAQWVYVYATNRFFNPGGFQRLILAAVLMIVGFQTVMIGLLADVISGTRKLLEDLLYRVRKMELRGPDDDRDDTTRDAKGR